jgi:hypothetical protein
MSPTPPKWLTELNSPWPVLGIVAVEAGILGYLFNKRPDLLIPLSILGALLALVLLTVFSIERLRSAALSLRQTQIVCRRIHSRREMYLECTRLIRTSQTIRDTTWGKSPKELTPIEKAARKEYREAIDRALDDGKDYREMFCVGDDRQNLVEAARLLATKHHNHEVRFLEGIDLAKISMFDIVIGDSSKVILAHVAGTDPTGDTSKFIYIESPELVGFLLHFWSDCWNPATNAKTPRLGVTPSANAALLQT